MLKLYEVHSFIISVLGYRCQPYLNTLLVCDINHPISLICFVVYRCTTAYLDWLLIF